MTLRIVARTLFGHATTSREIKTISQAMAALQSSLVTANLPLPNWASPTRYRLQKHLKKLNAIVFSMIERRRREGIEERSDLLSSLLGAVDEEGDGKGLTSEEIRSQLLTLFLAGHETTSNALTWTLYLLSSAPDAERELQAEADTVLGDDHGQYHHYEKLTTTRKVLKESLRLFPPVYVMARMATEDVRLGEWYVPKGSEVVLWIYHVQRDPSIFRKPWEFRPERFSKEAEATLPRGAYFPFGAGSRACIGSQFAMLEATLALATLSRRYRFRTPSDHSVELAPRVTLAPKGGLPMLIEERTRR